MGGPLRHAQHVIRMAGLFLAGVLAFLVLRSIFVPADFGTLGHYRASALTTNRDKPLAYAGHAACAECHPDVVDKRAGQRHARVACEGCHGPSARHAAAEEGAPNPPRPDGRTTCLRCHERDASRPPAHPQITPAEHAPEGPCLACHDAHAPRLS